MSVRPSGTPDGPAIRAKDDMKRTRHDSHASGHGEVFKVLVRDFEAASSFSSIVFALESGNKVRMEK